MAIKKRMSPKKLLSLDEFKDVNWRPQQLGVLLNLGLLNGQKFEDAKTCEIEVQSFRMLIAYMNSKNDADVIGVLSEKSFAVLQ